MWYYPYPYGRKKMFEALYMLSLSAVSNDLQYIPIYEYFHIYSIDTDDISYNLEIVYNTLFSVLHKDKKQFIG